MPSAMQPTSPRRSSRAGLLVPATASLAPGHPGRHVNTYVVSLISDPRTVRHSFDGRTIIWFVSFLITTLCSAAGRGGEKGPSSETPFTIELVRRWKKLNLVPVPLVADALATIGRCPNGVRANRWAGLTAARASGQGSPRASEVTATLSIPSIAFFFLYWFSRWRVERQQQQQQKRRYNVTLLLIYFPVRVAIATRTPDPV